MGERKIEISDFIREKERLQIFDRAGKIYIPKDIRDQFRGYVFYITINNGKIVLDPIKIE